MRPKVCQGTLSEELYEVFNGLDWKFDDNKLLNIALIYGSWNTDGANNK